MLKYSEEEERELYDGYKSLHDQESRELFIDAFVKKSGKSKRSVVAKLSKMDIYISPMRVSKVTGVKAETKESMVSRIEAKYGLQGLDGLDKAPKLTLLKLLGEAK